MLIAGEDELICDFAETYQIYDYRALPLRKAAIFAVGLRDDSRIKMKIAGCDISLEALIHAAIADRIGLLVWMQSEDGRKNRNRPESIINLILKKQGQDAVHETFETGEAFDKEWKRLNGKEVS